ncbi:hypothetical protein T8K17_09495 [Thalassobaculum sp. OXR-137]|uniref:hypothetical protein n=1 Tax=Thalassobaculum sp. OXR-137 TaxID=3100173 RepID=UPI002AC8B9C8|nr:hypothetical protein [Thalassobaculum sp. OXR-137]WPZ36370.1 hypothetical protein T8K17_09495 [Thalassobaculum sp. OXR-137]
MDELSFEYTLDSHRPPTATPPTLVIECLDALDYAKHNIKALPGALHLLKELETRTRGNPIIKEMVNIDLDSFFQVDKTSPEEIFKRLSVLSGEIKQYPYSIKCFKLIQRILDEEKLDRKIDLDFLCRELVSSLINLGLSSQWIHNSVVKFFFEEKVPNDIDVRNFWKIIFPHTHWFKVVTPIDSKVHLVEDSYLSAFGAKIINKDDVDDLKEHIDPVCGEYFQRVVVSDDVRAKDPYEAVEVANHRIARLHHVYGLFNHKHSLSIGDGSYVIQKCCTEIKGIYSNSLNRMQFVRDKLPARAARAMETMMKEIRFPNGPDKKKFFNAVSFHGMSTNSTSVENQLVNIWTALETITPESFSGSTISNVTHGVLPFIGLNYMSRLLRCLLGDILRWNRKLAYRAIKSAKCGEDHNLLQQLYCLLSLKENEDILSDLFKNMGDFHLLRYRTYTHHKTLKSRQATHKAVEDHERRVEWQIHRIYRTRNLVVHRGQLPSFAKTLVVNAHDYFDQVFELTCSLGGKNQYYNTYSNCFNYMEMRYNKYKNDLLSKDPISTNDAEVVLWFPPGAVDDRALLPE